MVGKIFRVLLKSVLWVVGIWAALLILMEAVLSESVLTGIVNKYAAEYVDGNLKFGKASVSMFRRFPNITVSLEDFSITYPSDRFALQEKQGAQSAILWRRSESLRLH